MKARLFLTISIAATMLWSCQFDDVLSTPSNDGVIRVTSTLTKTESASGTTTNSSTTNDNFKRNEIIYVWADKTGTTDGYIKAWQLTATDTNGNFRGDSKAWPYDGLSLDFHALHGNFTETELDKKWSDLTSLTHTVLPDQSSVEDRRKSDLPFAEKTGATHGSNVGLSFRHLLAKITVKLDLRNSKGISNTELERAQVTLTNIQPEATFKSSAGAVASAGGDHTTIKAGIISSSINSGDVIGSAIVPLQSFGNNDNSNIIQIALSDGRIFSYTPDATNLEKSMEYTYTLKIINGELSVSDIRVNELDSTTADKSWDIYVESEDDGPNVD